MNVDGSQTPAEIIEAVLLGYYGGHVPQAAHNALAVAQIRLAADRKRAVERALAPVRALADELEAAEIADLRDHHSADLRAALSDEPADEPADEQERKEAEEPAYHDGVLYGIRHPGPSQVGCVYCASTLAQRDQWAPKEER